MKTCMMIPFVVILVATASGGGTGAYETPHNRQVSDILSADTIAGPHYTIRDKVVCYGYLDHYTVDSDFGVFEVTGDGALRKVNEYTATGSESSGSFEMWMTGRLSALAKEQLIQLGVTVVENVGERISFMD